MRLVLPSVVIYNENTASDIRIGDESDGYRFQRICYGNENRLFPPGCFLQDGVIKYNDDTIFSTCSVEKTCYCSFSIPLLEIEGGVKEALQTLPVQKSVTPRIIVTLCNIMIIFVTD